MAAGESGVVFAPLCQGFLKKRKDKMKMRWVTYWFKLHNTTLFFYTKKHGSTSDLRGQYYLFEVESVRELMRTENKRYQFEITMKNGKRKVLAAETADLRHQWICQLLKAMKRSTPAITETDPDWDAESNHKMRTQSSPNNCLRNQDWHDALIRPYSTLSVTCHYTSGTDSDPVTPDATPRTSTALSVSEYRTQSLAEEQQKTEETEPKPEPEPEPEPEHDYDVLPTHKALNCDDAIYDTPLSNRRASNRDQEMTESIYDVPKSIFRKMTAYMNEGQLEQRPESVSLLSDMMECLGDDSADWVRAATQEQSDNLSTHSKDV